jgi:hypothetical protein
MDFYLLLIVVIVYCKQYTVKCPSKKIRGISFWAACYVGIFYIEVFLTEFVCFHIVQLYIVCSFLKLPFQLLVSKSLKLVFHV